MMMMKFNRVALLLLSGTILFACKNNSNNNDVVNPSGASAAYSGLKVSIASRSLRALDQEDYDGRGAESTVASIHLLSTAGNKDWTESVSAKADGENKFWSSSTGVYTVNPWKVEAVGGQSMAILLNKGDFTGLTPTNAKNFVYGSKDEAIENLAAFATDNKFVMTSKVDAKTILKGKTQKDVEDGTAETDNVFGFNVERVVAQGIVMKGTKDLSKTTDGKGSISDLNYAAVNGAVKTYLFANHAGNRKMETTTDFSYNGYESAIHGSEDFSSFKDATAVADKLIRFGNLGQTDASKLGLYKAIPVADNATIGSSSPASAPGVYFFENSVDHSKMDDTNKPYGFYRLAYAKIYAVYTPEKVLHLEGSSLVEKDGVKGETFYVGAKDGLYYASPEAVTTAIADQAHYTYTDGKCAYRVLWNRQIGSDKAVKNADTRRNNVYVLTIDGIKKIGMPFDPSDPNDPNLPKPDPKDPQGPDEGIDDPSIEKQDTYMRVTAKILPWNKVSRNVTLE